MFLTALLIALAGFVAWLISTLLQFRFGREERSFKEAHELR